jgi:NADH dehydrogenase
MEAPAGRRPDPERSASGPVVLVLGASGFIGRHAVGALLDLGCRPVIGSRHPGRIDHRLPTEAQSCPRRRVRFERLLATLDWLDLLDGVDVVLNSVGILRERGRETYERVHTQAPAALAGACRERGLPLIHVSALGLDARARSGFLRSKLAGEKALRASGANWCIVRPSLLDGDGGFGAAWLRRVSRWPVHPLPAIARCRIAPLHVRDLGEALARLAARLGTGESLGTDRELDLGGSDERTLADHLDALRRLYTARPARKLRIPGLLTRGVSHLCDLLHLTPFSFGHWELLGRDNCPARSSLPALLGRAPRPVGRREIAPFSGPGTVTKILPERTGFGLSFVRCASAPKTRTEPASRPKSLPSHASSASLPRSARIPRVC